MAHVSSKLTGSLQGALAGGGDPATSPLYVFGPFLQHIVVAGVASVTFGASIWLAVLTVVTVSAMYRQVMTWVSDGTGGSGLSEEEFGPWAVKINASITAIEYTLTFLVSMAALVTFVADRLPSLNEPFLWFPRRTYVAILLSVATGVAVNRGPKTAARAFGPATAAVLLLLWVMIFATIWRFGFHLPDLQREAFSQRYLGFTLGGYARILALMTGIEIFANLVAAYEGPARERSRKAFGSLMIVMTTTSATMLVVGPAIHAMSNPLDPEVSVFTQTMDKLLPGPLAYVGTLIGIAVLLSAAAASAQGIQNLALGLRFRHYVPASWGQRNRFEVAGKPVWIEIAICTICFLVFGTEEHTYLSLYAAGVFILLSLTGWAAVKRLWREQRRSRSGWARASLAGTATAAVLTTGATAIIFEDRFMEGAWAYALLVPVLYVALGYNRAKLGEPSRVEDRLGRALSCSYLPRSSKESLGGAAAFRNILVPLDQSALAERAKEVASSLSRAYGAKLTLLTVVPPLDYAGAPSPSVADGSKSPPDDMPSAREYLESVAADVKAAGDAVDIEVRRGDASDQIGALARSGSIDAVVMSTRGRTAWTRWMGPSVTSSVIFQTTPPLIVVRPTDEWRSSRTRFSRVLAAIDGSETAEQILPYVYELGGRFGSDVVLLSVPEGSESDEYAATLRAYLSRIAGEIEGLGLRVRVVTEGAGPAQTILRVALAERVDLIMMVSHGRGGVARQEHVRLGSVVERVLQETPCPVFLVSALPPSASSTATKQEASELRTDRLRAVDA